MLKSMLINLVICLIAGIAVVFFIANLWLEIARAMLAV